MKNTGDIPYEKERFSGLSRNKFCEALRAEGTPIGGGYNKPVYKDPLWAINEKEFPFTEGIDYSKVYCPATEKASFEEAVAFFHQNLLGTKEDVDDIVKAIIKVKENVEELL